MWLKYQYPELSSSIIFKFLINAIFSHALAPKKLFFTTNLPAQFQKITELNLTSHFTYVRETRLTESGISGIFLRNFITFLSCFTQTDCYCLFTVFDYSSFAAFASVSYT